jgi:hypothetical protein
LKDLARRFLTKIKQDDFGSACNGKQDYLASSRKISGKQDQA